MNNFEDMDHKDKFHMHLVVQIWDKIAGLVYGRYKKEGRGVVVMFMVTTLPLKRGSFSGHAQANASRYALNAQSERKNIPSSIYVPVEM